MGPAHTALVVKWGRGSDAMLCGVLSRESQGFCQPLASGGA